MGELSVEEKAQRYDEAIKKVNDYYEGKTKLYSDVDKTLGYLFPELADSNDERIRKALVRFHKSTVDIDGIKGADILAWLEKQGESYTKKDIDDAYMKGICDAKHELEKQGEQKPILDFKASNWYVSKVDGKIHDMTYNPADKVEPRFKVKYAGSEYNVLEVKDIAGVTFYGIEDEPNHIDYVKAENCEIISGYAIKENGSPYPTKPAVFSEKKSAAWSDEDEHRVEDTIYFLDTAKKYYACTIGLDACIDWLKSIKDRVGCEVNCTTTREWSEEEKKRIDRIINVLDWAEDKGRISYSDWEDYVTYVRCLRPQPNTKWYKLDDNMQKKIINYFECQREIEPTRKDILNTWIDWLKSLRPQNHWQPSDEQMDALRYVFQHYLPTPTDTLAWDALKTIELMLDQLKELRKE